MNDETFIDSGSIRADIEAMLAVAGLPASMHDENRQWPDGSESAPDSCILAATRRREADELLGRSPKPREHADVLGEIVESLAPVDFQAEAGLGPKEKVSLKHLRVITVRHVLNRAREIDCGLARSLDFVYVFNGCYWRLIDKSDIEDFLGMAAETLGVDWITAKDYKFRGELFKQFLSAGYLPTSRRTNAKTLINFQNGTFEISAEGQSLREFRRDDFLTYQLPFAFDENAVAPIWQTFLNEVLPDKTKQDVLAEFFGYLFLRTLKLEKALILYGTGANGKSVVFYVINALLGEPNVSNYSLDALGHPYFRGHLANKILNYCPDISNRLQAAIFKLMVSGEPIEARFPYGQPFIMTDYARLAFNANEFPRDVEHTEAFFRRFLIVHFDHFVPEDERDHDLANKIIRTELPGVFNWILEGVDRLLINKGFSASPAVTQILASYRRESDSVAMFLEDEGYVTSDSWISLKELYPIYKRYCLDNGYTPLGNKNFRQRLEANSVTVAKRNIGKIVFLERRSTEY